jgi:hypothetical protein
MPVAFTYVPVIRRTMPRSAGSLRQAHTHRNEANMTTREIGREERREFFDAFSRQHDGWLVTVEVTDAEIGAQIEGTELRLRGISADDGYDSSLSIMLESFTGDHVTHIVRTPTHVWLEQTGDGADVALQIEAADGTNTLLRFRSVIRPEAVDGVPTGTSASR